MKTNYFTKVENKYVFNVSLIFWHLFIALSSLAIVICLAVLLWSLIPTLQRKVVKQTYPEKRQYPALVKVSLDELNLEKIKKEKAPPVASESVQTTTPKAATQKPAEDIKGKTKYEASLIVLKTIIPPSKYSWKGSGHWTYPYGERYWTFYKQEKYRKWNVTKSGIEDKLKHSYKTARAGNYPDKKQILDGYISVIKLLPEKRRSIALKHLIRNVANNISQNVNVYRSLTKVVSKMPPVKNISYLDKLARFGKKNPNDGSLFIDYIATIIDKFDVAQRASIIDRLINSYYNYFNQNLAKQKEATDLFLPLVGKIKSKHQTKAIMKYYGLFFSKNYQRNNEIAQIENEYQQAISDIDYQFSSDQEDAQMKYNAKKFAKKEFRLKALMGIGSGIGLIVLIATVLVFLSIQRSVKKIEENILAINNDHNMK